MKDDSLLSMRNKPRVCLSQGKQDLVAFLERGVGFKVVLSFCHCKFLILTQEAIDSTLGSALLRPWASPFLLLVKFREP